MTEITSETAVNDIITAAAVVEEASNAIDNTIKPSLEEVLEQVKEEKV